MRMGLDDSMCWVEPWAELWTVLSTALFKAPGKLLQMLPLLHLLSVSWVGVFVKCTLGPGTDWPSRVRAAVLTHHWVADWPARCSSGGVHPRTQDHESVRPVCSSSRKCHPRAVFLRLL